MLNTKNYKEKIKTQNDDVKRGYMRGKKLTDKQSQEMLFREQIKLEETTSKIIKELRL